MKSTFKELTNEELLLVTGGQVKTFENGGYIPISSGIYPRQ
ncbi:hypothetical protein [Lactococcus hircilactis]|nr:hypothetical protein [Lactococcus hircilactis]